MPCFWQWLPQCKRFLHQISILGSFMVFKKAGTWLSLNLWSTDTSSQLQETYWPTKRAGGGIFTRTATRIWALRFLWNLTDNKERAACASSHAMPKQYPGDVQPLASAKTQECLLNREVLWEELGKSGIQQLSTSYETINCTSTPKSGNPLLRPIIFKLFLFCIHFSH